MKWITKFASFFIFILSISTVTSDKINKSSRAGEELRLPRSVLPRLYEVTLLPILIEGNFTTEGSVNILVDCVLPTSNITLHIADITFSSSSVLVTNPISFNEWKV